MMKEWFAIMSFLIWIMIFTIASFDPRASEGCCRGWEPESIISHVAWWVFLPGRKSICYLTQPLETWEW